MFTFPYDPTGKKPSNRFTEEHVITSDINENRTIVLKHRPFFAEGFEARVAGASVPLTLGTDYELTHEIPELESAIEGHLFCSVQLINPVVAGTIVFSGQLIGGDQYDPLTEILDYLIKHLNNPPNYDYQLLNGLPSLMPPDPAAMGWSDMLNKKYVASAIHDIEVNSEEANADITNAIGGLKNEIIRLVDSINNFNYPAHIAAQNPHATTAAQSNAHPIDLKAPDAFMAYGKRLSKLVDDIRALGLREADLDAYMESWLSKSVSGAFIYNISSGTPQVALRSPGSESKITFTREGFKLESQGSVVLAVGGDYNTSAGRYVEWFTDHGSLMITSTGDKLGMSSITLNNRQLLTTSSLMEYQGQGGGSGEVTDPDDNQLYITGEDGLTFRGKGSKADPVSGEVVFPVASTSAPGVATIQATPGPQTEGVAAAPGSITPYMGELNKYVPKTYTINKKPMTGSGITITKGDVGLDRVDNTSDVDKPLSADQNAELIKLSEKVHKHPWSELYIPSASPNTYGITKLGTSINGLAANKAVTPSVLNSQHAIADEILKHTAGARSDGATEFSALNGSTWSIAGTTLLVRDLKYFAVTATGKKMGTASGSIDLSTTPMFNWFKSENRLEDTWNNGVTNDSVLESFDGLVEKPLVPLYARQIGMRIGEVGSSSVVTILAKKRLTFGSSRAVVYVAGGGDITVYIDGVVAGSGPSPLSVGSAVVGDNRTKCIAIKVECRDGARNAALRFEVHDAGVPIYRSSLSTKLSYLNEFVPTNSKCKHHLYFNMNTGSFYSRAEPIQANGVDLTSLLIGTVTMEEVRGAAGNGLSFPTTRCFGRTEEVSSHEELTHQHQPKEGDWKFSDNPNFQFKGKLVLNPQMVIECQPLPGQEGSVGYYSHGGVSDVCPTNQSMDYHTLTLWQTADHGPWCWFTPYNPKCNNHPTYEGGAVLDYTFKSGNVGLSTHPELYFVAEEDVGCDFVYVKHDLTIGLGRFGIPPTELNFRISYKKLYPNVINPRSRKTLTTTLAKVLDYDYVSDDDLMYLNRHPRYHFRYRYDCETRVLYVLRISCGPHNDFISIDEIEYDIPFMMERFFTGYVGYGTDAVNRYLHTRIMPGLMEIKDSRVNSDKYSYFSSLYDSYLDCRFPEDSSDQYKRSFSIRKRALTYDTIATLEDTISLTERHYLPIGGAYPEQNRVCQLPYCFRGGWKSIGPVINRNGGDKWFGWASPDHWTKPVAYRAVYSPTMVVSNPGDDLTCVAVNLHMMSTVPFAIVCGGGLDENSVVIKHAPITASNGEDVRVDFPTKENIQEIYVVFFPTETGGINAWIEGDFLNAKGASVMPVRDSEITGLFYLDEVAVVDKRTAFHMTPYLWNYALREMKKERDTRARVVTDTPVVSEDVK